MVVDGTSTGATVYWETVVDVVLVLCYSVLGAVVDGTRSACAGLMRS